MKTKDAEERILFLLLNSQIYYARYLTLDYVWRKNSKALNKFNRIVLRQEVQNSFTQMHAIYTAIQFYLSTNGGSFAY